MNVKWFFLVFLTTITLTIKAQLKQELYPDADKLFNEMYRVLSEEYSKTDELGRMVFEQHKFEKFQNLGLEFWRLYPGDIRKYKWFVTMVNNTKWYYYWKDPEAGSKIYLSGKPYKYYIPIDQGRLKNWELVCSEMKSEFLRYCSEDKSAEVRSRYYSLLIGELAAFLSLSRNLDFRNNGKVDIDKLRNLFFSAAEILNDSVNIYTRVELTNLMDNDFIAVYSQLGLTDNEIYNFVDSLSISRSFEIQEWASQRKALLSLRWNPLHLKHNGMNGKEVDLEKLRGKVVLVDFWSLNCIACITRMPYLKKMFDKYRSHGFEVISVATDSETEWEKVDQVRKRIGADWPTLIIGGKNISARSESLTVKIWDKYGFSGVPQLLLLDKEGCLVILNDILRSGDIEPILKELLDVNY